MGFIDILTDKVTRFNNFTALKVIVTITFLNFHLIVEIKVFALRFKRRRVHLFYVWRLSDRFAYVSDEKHIEQHISACDAYSPHDVLRSVTPTRHGFFFHENRRVERFH